MWTKIPSISLCNFVSDATEHGTPDPSLTLAPAADGRIGNIDGCCGEWTTTQATSRRLIMDQAMARRWTVAQAKVRRRTATQAIVACEDILASGPSLRKRRQSQGHAARRSMAGSAWRLASAPWLPWETRWRWGRLSGRDCLVGNGQWAVVCGSRFDACHNYSRATSGAIARGIESFFIGNCLHLILSFHVYL
jgi:hypothetical protein